MKTATTILTFVCCFILGSCSGDNDRLPLAQSAVPSPPDDMTPDENATQYKYLALGDSYTIGQSVCETCRFPAQLKNQLDSTLDNATVNLNIIATTGWTTTNLLNAINAQNPANDNDLVTLLIGVNNQFQNKPFSLYEIEFPQLVSKAIALAKGDPANVIVVSIPDYRYTPFGNGLINPDGVSQQINQYNAFAQQYCSDNNITFIGITDITRQGLENPNLVASDGLHPSELAYALFTQRLFPQAVSVLSE